MNGNITAPPGQVWVCEACGKRSRDRYGNNQLSGVGAWDAGCVLNAILCYESKLTIDNDGFVTNIAEGGVVEEKSKPAITAGEGVSNHG